MGYESIPLNGIYVMFEKGEYGHNGDRVVRIGTHTGENQLKSRLYQHFENENKNRSIFRKNIGRCFLQQDNNPYLSVWELDTTTRKKKEQHSHLIDKDLEIKIEKKISKYIQENLTFCLFNMPTKNFRLYYEARLIGTVSNCCECGASETWLGRQSTKDKIKKSGLWQEMELYSTPLTYEELSAISLMIIKK